MIELLPPYEGNTALSNHVLVGTCKIRNQIRDTLNEDTGKIAFGRIKYKFRTWSNKNSKLCTVDWYIEMVRTSRLLLLLMLSLLRCLSRGEIRPTLS
jgi:hypothetical protein